MAFDGAKGGPDVLEAPRLAGAGCEPLTVQFLGGVPKRIASRLWLARWFGWTEGDRHGRDDTPTLCSAGYPDADPTPSCVLSPIRTTVRMG